MKLSQSAKTAYCVQRLVIQSTRAQVQSFQGPDVSYPTVLDRIKAVAVHSQIAQSLQCRKSSVVHYVNPIVGEIQGRKSAETFKRLTGHLCETVVAE